MDEGDDNPKVITHPPILFLGALLIGLGLNYAWPLGLLLEGARWPLAIGLVLVAGALAFTCVKKFIAAGTNIPTNRPVNAIVTTGPYRYSRNPIYIALSLLYIGLSVACDSLWSLVLLGPTLLILTHGVIVREERYLAEKFGAEYTDYAEKVHRWF